MKPNIFNSLQKILRLVIAISGLATLLLVAVIVFVISPELVTHRFLSHAEKSPMLQTAERDGSSGESLLVDDPNLAIVVANCTNCHSERLIVQNRASREGWAKMILWMQEKQGLWPLGANEDIILDYLAKNYAPKAAGRRAHLEKIEWYTLED